MRLRVGLSIAFVGTLSSLCASGVAAAAVTGGDVQSLPQGDIAAPVSMMGKSPQSRALYLKLIGDLAQSGQTHAALAHLDSFDKMYPQSDDAAILRGNCLVTIADYAAAATVYGRLVRGREAAAAYAGLGRIDALAGRWSASLPHYAQAVRIAPTSPLYLNDYGFALLRAGNAADAVFRLRQAAELAPNDPRPRSNLVLALAANGDEAGARRLLATLPDPAQRREIEAELVARSKEAGTPPAKTAAAVN